MLAHCPIRSLIMEDSSSSAIGCALSDRSV
jgi:hypothetical protein